MGIRASRLRPVTVLLGLPVAVMIAGTGASAAFGGSTPHPVNPAVEAQNYVKTTERQEIYLTPQYKAQLHAVGTQNTSAAVAAQAADQERAFTTDLCWNGNDGCAGDVRLYNWQAHGYGIVSRCCSPPATERHCPVTCGQPRQGRPSGRRSSLRTARFRPTNSCTGWRLRPWPRPAMWC
jgi:hypothetical protein